MNETEMLDQLARERMSRFARACPEAAREYTEAQADMARLVSAFQRLLVAGSPQEVGAYASIVQTEAAMTAERWRTAKGLFARFAEHDFPPVAYVIRE